MKSIKYIMITMLYVFSLQIFGGERSQQLTNPGLSYESFRSLENASNSLNYLINILQREINGKLQTVILIGESHKKTKQASDQGKEIIRSFDVIGIETVFASEHEKELAFALKYSGEDKPVRVGVPIKGIPQNFIDKLASELKNANHGDSISDAFAYSNSLFKEASQSEVFFFYLLQSYEKNLHDLGKAIDKPYLVKDMRPHLKEYLNSLHFADDFIIDTNSVHEVLHKVRKKLMKGRLDLFLIEKNHPSNFKEIVQNSLNIKRGMHIARAGIAGLILTAAISSFSGYNFSTTCFGGMCAMVTSTAVLYINGKLNKVVPEGLAVRHTNWAEKFQSERDIFMAQGIIDGLQIRPDLEYLPIIMGMAHNKGVKDILMHQHSFREISLKDLDPSR